MNVSCGLITCPVKSKISSSKDWRYYLEKRAFVVIEGTELVISESYLFNFSMDR